MQTFIPDARSYRDSVACLDGPRLGKQRVETMQLITAITGLALPNAREIERGAIPGVVIYRGPDRAWQHHPAARMWADNVLALWAYQVATIEEWTRRGYADTCLEKTRLILTEADLPWRSRKKPDWWGDPAVHLSHRANLVRKNPDYYLKFWPGTVPVEGYVWPVAS